MARIYNIPIVASGNGDAVECASLRDKSVQISGSFTASLQVQGSIDGSNWVSEGSAQTTPGVVNITTSWVFIRINAGAITGTPKATLCGHEER